MASDDKKKPINNALEDALKEFEGSGGFDAGTSSNSQNTSKEHENAFNEEFEDVSHDSHNQKHHKDNNDDEYIEYEDDEHGDEIDQDFDVMDDDLEEDDEDEQEQPQKKERSTKVKSSGGNSGDGGNSPIIQKLKEPKNLIILIIAICFLLFLIFGGKKPKEIKTQENLESNIVSEVVEMSSLSSSDENQTRDIAPPVKKKKQEISQVVLSDIQLPSLDIKMPEIKTEDTDLIPKIPEPKTPDEKMKIQLKERPADINIEEIKIRNKDDSTKKAEEIPEVGTQRKKRDPIANKDGNAQKSLITEFATGSEVDFKQKKKGSSHDFIFIDTDLDIDKENENSVISATRIQNPENVISQGRIIDAVLETAVNSSISGQVRAIVTRDVYAEVGRNILIPKGTRLYGEYGAAATSAVGNGPNAGGRIVIKWSRIMRPDNVSASIDSFASDQFGRSGISGQVDNNYIGGITSTVLLSMIPLVTTIVANAITNTNPQTVTVGSTTGNATVIQDPVNIATQAFTKSVAQVITDVTKNAISTQPTITLDQGTRVKVLVNKDIKLPTYKALTKSSGSISAD